MSFWKKVASTLFAMTSTVVPIFPSSGQQAGTPLWRELAIPGSNALVVGGAASLAPLLLLPLKSSNAIKNSGSAAIKMYAMNRLLALLLHLLIGSATIEVGSVKLEKANGKIGARISSREIYMRFGFVGVVILTALFFFTYGKGKKMLRKELGIFATPAAFAMLLATSVDVISPKLGELRNVTRA